MSANSPTTPNKISGTDLVDWGSSYPRSDYQNKGLRSRTYTLHFQIVLSGSEESINHYITNLHTKKFYTKLYSADPDTFNLTPLMIAVMKAKSLVVDHLLKVAKETNHLSQSLNAKDEFGWTPLHHAALTSDAIYQMLSSHGASKTALNCGNGTAEDIKNLVSHDVPSPSASKITVFQDNGQATPLLNIAKENIKSILGISEYRDFNYFSRKEYKHLWKAFKSDDCSDSLFYTQFLENPPLLGIRQCKELKGITESSKELIAMENLPAGRVVLPFSGVIDHNPKTPKPETFASCYNGYSIETAYQREKLFSHERSNALIYANFGFPNLIHMKVLAGGMKCGLFLSAGIRKGEPLLWDYGPAMPWLTYGKMHIFAKETMREFFKNGLQYILNTLKTIRSENPLIASIINARLRFPLSAPAAVLDLHFNRLVSANDWHEHLRCEINSPILQWVSLNPFETIHLRCLLKSVITLEAAIDDNTNLRNLISTWVLKNNGQLSIMQILKIFENIKLQIKTSSSIDWKVFLTEQEILIAHYDWNQDPNPTIGIEAAKNAMIEFYENLTHTEREATLNYNVVSLLKTGSSLNSDPMIILSSLAEKYAPEIFSKLNLMKKQ